MTNAYINHIATSVPTHDVHAAFQGFARGFLPDQHSRQVFDRLVKKSGIDHRYAVLPPVADSPDRKADDWTRLYGRNGFPTTGQRMELYEKYAAPLAVSTVKKLDLGVNSRQITHVIVTSCTGMYAPGLDFDLIAQCDLNPSVERTMIGFMGCYAAMNALKLSRHIVRSTPDARVLVVNLELCSLHMQETHSLEQLLSFLVFADGCAASIVSADPEGIAMDRFYAAQIPNTHDLITWKVRDFGFDMFLSGKVPTAIAQGLESKAGTILDGTLPSQLDLWAVHPGGRTILDAVEKGLGLDQTALTASRDILARYGNMSSATVMFVLQSILASSKAGQRGCAMSFGPGLTAETMLFHRA